MFKIKFSIFNIIISSSMIIVIIMIMIIIIQGYSLVNREPEEECSCMPDCEDEMSGGRCGSCDGPLGQPGYCCNAADETSECPEVLRWNLFLGDSATTCETSILYSHACIYKIDHAESEEEEESLVQYQYNVQPPAVSAFLLKLIHLNIIQSC